MRIMAIDYGTVRVGIALTDPDAVIAQPFLTLPAKNRAQLLDRLGRIVRENAVGLILVGNPISMKGQPTPQSLAVEQFVKDLRAVVPIEVRLWDERYTSRLADTMLKEKGIRRSVRRTDEVAAAIMLDEYLQREVGSPA